MSAPGADVPPNHTPQPTCIVFFRCPRCPHQLPGTKQAFDQGNLDKIIWCNQCQRNLFVRLWQCRCGLPWHTCPRHKGEPDRLRALQHTLTPPTPAVQTAQPRPRPKRKLGQGRDQQIQRWLDQPQPKRYRPAPAEVELGVVDQLNSPPRVKHYLLGPKLQAKFPKLGHTACTPTAPAAQPEATHPQQ